MSLPATLTQVALGVAVFVAAAPTLSRPVIAPRAGLALSAGGDAPTVGPRSAWLPTIDWATAAAGTAPAAAPTTAPAAAAAPATAAAAAAKPAPAANATEVVDRIQQFYAAIKQVTAEFRQTVSYETYGTSKASDGTVRITKPGKMRWDYVAKRKPASGKGDPIVEVNKTFISNGVTLYVIEHDNKQVTKKNLQQDLMPVAISFLYGKGDLKAEFTAELDASGKYGEKTDVVVKLSPRQPSAQYKHLFLVASAKDFHVSQSIIVDASNNVNHFRFFAPDFESPIKPSLFEFDERSVKSYRITDADAAKDGAAKDGAAKPVAPPTPPTAPARPTPAPAK